MNELYRMQGCLDPKLNGMVVRVIRPHEHLKMFVADERKKPWVEVETPMGVSFADQSRLVPV